MEKAGFVGFSEANSWENWLQVLRGRVKNCGKIGQVHDILAEKVKFRGIFRGKFAGKSSDFMGNFRGRLRQETISKKMQILLEFFLGKFH